MLGNAEGRSWYIAGLKAIVKGLWYVIKFLIGRGRS